MPEKPGTVRKKEGSYEMSVGEASVADTKTRKDDFLERCEDVQGRGRVFSWANLFPLETCSLHRCHQ